MKRWMLVCLTVVLLLAACPAVAEGWTCPGCGRLNTVNYCPVCGTKKPVWVCPECGYENFGAFCEFCGKAKPVDEFAETEEISVEIKDQQQASASRASILFGTQDDGPWDTILLGVANSLSWNGYEVVNCQLNDPSFVPDPQDLLVIFSPQEDLNESDKEKVEKYILMGGNILFIYDIETPLENMPRYQSLLCMYGFAPLAGIVVEGEPNRRFNNKPYMLIPEMLFTDITQDLFDYGQDYLVLSTTAAFEMPGEETDRSLSVSVILQSSETSYLKSFESMTFEYEDNDRKGPLALALEAKRITSEGYISRAFIICEGAFYDSDMLLDSGILPLMKQVITFLRPSGITDPVSDEIPDNIVENDEETEILDLYDIFS